MTDTKTMLDDREPAPPNSLPDWSECELRVENSNFIAKRVAEGGYSAESDSKLASALHRFIYEYDDADNYRSAWFMHHLELVLKEAEAAWTRKPAAQVAGVEPFAWQWRKKGEAWTLANTFNSRVYATTADSEVRALYPHPAPEPDATKVVSVPDVMAKGNPIYDALMLGIGELALIDREKGEEYAAVVRAALAADRERT
jgi:hypothetical protein